MSRKKDRGLDDFRSHAVIGSRGLIRMLDCSLSHLYRLLDGSSPTATPFPRPFSLGGSRYNSWKVEDVLRWIDEQKAAANATE